MGTTLGTPSGVVILFEYFERNAAASTGEATALVGRVGDFEGAEEDWAKVWDAGSSLRLFFLSFSSFLHSEVPASDFLLLLELSPLFSFLALWGWIPLWRFWEPYERREIHERAELRALGREGTFSAGDFVFDTENQPRTCRKNKGVPAREATRTLHGAVAARHARLHPCLPQSAAEYASVRWTLRVGSYSPILRVHRRVHDARAHPATQSPGIQSNAARVCIIFMRSMRTG